MGTLAPRIEMRPFEMQPEKPAQVLGGRRNPGLDWLTRYATAVGHIIAVIPTPQENP